MGGNNFYVNPEAYAMEILQQRLVREAQMAAQQTVMELSVLKTLFNHGQFLFCIPCNGGLFFQPPPMPFPYCPLPCMPPPHLDPALLPPPDIRRPAPLSLPPPAAACQTAPPAPNPTNSHPPSQQRHQSTVHVNVKNPHQQKVSINKPGVDECNLGRDGIEVIIDLRDYIPAEISLEVDEMSVEIKATHLDSHGCRTFARKYDLPACIILDSTRCILTHDGFLLFSAAWCKME